MKNLDLKSIKDIPSLINNKNLESFFENKQGFSKEYSKFINLFAKNNVNIKSNFCEDCEEICSDDNNFKLSAIKNENGKITSLSSVINLQNSDLNSHVEIFLSPLKDGYATSFYQYTSNNFDKSRSVFGYEVYDGHTLKSLSSVTVNTQDDIICKSSYSYENDFGQCTDDLYTKEDVTKQFHPGDLVNFRQSITECNDCDRDCLINCSGEDKANVYKQMKAERNSFFESFPILFQSEVASSGLVK